VVSFFVYGSRASTSQLQIPREAEQMLKNYLGRDYNKVIKEVSNSESQMVLGGNCCDPNGLDSPGYGDRKLPVFRVQFACNHQLNALET